MAENSGIEWTTHTFNPWIGCTKVSAACDNCYAEAWDKRGLQGQPSRWGAHANRTLTKTWGNPRKWQKQAVTSGERPRVFCASLADIADNHKSIDQQWRRDLVALIRECPNLDFLLLTKRPQNVAKLYPDLMEEERMSDVRLIERWLPIAALSEESVRERRSMTALPP